MSVLNCDRNNCDKAMCSILIDNRYVCRSCAQEFEHLMGDQMLPAGEMQLKFAEFMKTEKQVTFDPYAEPLTAAEFIQQHRRE